MCLEGRLGKHHRFRFLSTMLAGAVATLPPADFYSSDSSFGEPLRPTLLCSIAAVPALAEVEGWVTKIKSKHP